MKKFIPEIKAAVVMSILMIAILAMICILNREREKKTVPSVVNETIETELHN